MATQAQITAVQQLYVSYLGRAADKAGLDFWSNAIANGTSTIESVATGLTLATEYTTAYGNLSNDALVDAVYTNVLGRSADAAGKAFWVAAFGNGTVKADTFVASLIQSLGAQDQATINNKTFVAQTYTDTVGDQYTPAGGAAVIAGVTNDPATVTTAIGNISSGAVAGQVPGLALINAVVSADASVSAFETANKAAADALVTKLAANAATTDTDAINVNSSFADKVAAVVADAAEFRTNASSEKDVSVLETRAATAATTLTTSFNALSVAEKQAANKYVAAIAAEATAKTGVATVSEKAGVVAAFGVDASASAALTTHGGTASDLYAEYVNATAAARTSIDTEFAASTTYAAFKAAAVKDAAYADAIKATLSAKDVLDTDTTASTVTAGGFDTATALINGVKVVPTATDATAGTAASNKYVTDLAAKTSADTIVANVKAADVDVAAAKVIADAYTALNTTADNATAAIAKFNTDNSGVSKITDLGTSAAATAAKDTFYFADKAATVDAGADFSITTFAAGDSIVLGNGYTFNSGALTTGNNNALEFFIQKTDTGSQVVVESKVFGSASVTPDASTGVASANGDAVTVINLTGVTTDHLAVANGVVSYV